MNEEIKENYSFEKFIIACFLTGLGYLLSVTEIYDIFSFSELLSTGLPKLKNHLMTADFWQNFPFAPAVITWAGIGFVFYYFYYLLNLTYCNIYNWLKVKTSFVNQESDEEIDLKTLHRLLAHILVIIFYLLVIISVMTIFYPLAQNLRQTYYEIFSVFINKTYVFATSYFAVFIYWLGLIHILSFIISKAYQVEKEVEIAEEHIQI